MSLWDLDKILEERLHTNRNNHNTNTLGLIAVAPLISGFHKGKLHCSKTLLTTPYIQGPKSNSDRDSVTVGKNN